MQRFILKTDIKTRNQVELLTSLLERQDEIAKWSVDLDDVDSVLVVDTADVSRQEDLIMLVQSQGFNCSELPD